MVQRCGGNTYEKGRVKEERRGKELDRSPLTAIAILSFRPA
jgi:hypothetical protein